jgi:hypothetical protein
MSLYYLCKSGKVSMKIFCYMATVNELCVIVLHEHSID